MAYSEKTWNGAAAARNKASPAGDRRAQLRLRADLLRQADDGVGDRLDGGVERLADTAQRGAQIQGQGIVDGLAGITQRGLQQTGGDRVVGVIRLVRAARAARVSIRTGSVNTMPTRK